MSSQVQLAQRSTHIATALAVTPTSPLTMEAILPCIHQVTGRSKWVVWLGPRQAFHPLIYCLQRQSITTKTVLVATHTSCVHQVVSMPQATQAQISMWRVCGTTQTTCNSINKTWTDWASDRTAPLQSVITLLRANWALGPQEFRSRLTLSVFTKTKWRTDSPRPECRSVTFRIVTCARTREWFRLPSVRAGTLRASITRDKRAMPWTKLTTFLSEEVSWVRCKIS